MADERGEHEVVWSEDEWAQWEEYADQVRVEVRFRQWAGGPDLEEVWSLSSDGAAWPREWVVRQLRQVAAGSGGGGSYLLHVHDHRTEWGASGVVWEAALTLTESMIASGAWAGLGMLAENMRQRLAERSGRWAGSEEALVDEGVREAALHKVATMRAVPGEDLTVLSVESGTKPTTIVQIGAPDAKTYRVEVIDRGRVCQTRVSKITEGGPAT